MVLSVVRLLGCLEIASAWTVDFTDRQTALSRFIEDELLVDTSGCRACAEPSHLHYNQSLSKCDGETVLPSGQKGLEIVMDYNVTCNNENVGLATGHMQSHEYFMYGSFSFIMRGHHARGSCKEPETYAGFSCISLYTSTPLWNEVAMCFSKFSPHNEVHLTIYRGKPQGESVVKTPVFSAFVMLDEPAYYDFHNYTIQRLPSSVAFLVDGVKKIEIDELHCPELPDEPMRMKVILRPFRDTIEGNATTLSIQSLSAEPLDRDEAVKLEGKNLQEAPKVDTLTTAYLYIEDFGGSFAEWTKLKRTVFDALELEYPGRGLSSKYPIKLGRMLPHKRIAILQLGNQSYAAKVAALINQSESSWRAYAVTESDYLDFGIDKLWAVRDKDVAPIVDDMHLGKLLLLMAIALGVIGAGLFARVRGLSSSRTVMPQE